VGGFHFFKPELWVPPEPLTKRDNLIASAFNRLEYVPL
jgi:hypothetical protein